jgi:hypothetical protein
LVFGIWGVIHFLAGSKKKERPVFVESAATV